jgi:hypothetical protein
LSVLSAFGAVHRSAGQGLLGASSIERARDLASRLPPTTAGVSLECHLGPGCDRGDLIVRLLRSECTTVLSHGAPELSAARRFAMAWTSRPCLHHIPYIDLEFDLDGAARGCIVGAMIEPRLHSGVPAILAGRRSTDPTAPPPSCFAVAADVLQACAPQRLDPRILETVARCYSALPNDGFIGHVGLAPRMTRGPDDLVRLIVSLPKRATRSYLSTIGWPGNPTALERATDRRGQRQRLNLDLNVSPSGLSSHTAFYLTFWDLPAETGCLHKVLLELQADGLVTEPQATVLLRYARDSLRLRRTTLLKTITVKIMFRERSLGAKAYLSLFQNMERKSIRPSSAPVRQ